MIRADLDLPIPTRIMAARHSAIVDAMERVRLFNGKPVTDCLFDTEINDLACAALEALERMTNGYSR